MLIETLPNFETGISTKLELIKKIADPNFPVDFSVLKQKYPVKVMTSFYNSCLIRAVCSFLFCRLAYLAAHAENKTKIRILRSDCPGTVMTTHARSVISELLISFHCGISQKSRHFTLRKHWIRISPFPLC